MSIAEAKCLSDSRNNIVCGAKKCQRKRLNVPVSTIGMPLVIGTFCARPGARVAVSRPISDSAGSYAAVSGITPSAIVDAFDLGSFGGKSGGVTRTPFLGVAERSEAAEAALVLAETAWWR